MLHSTPLLPSMLDPKKKKESQPEIWSEITFYKIGDKPTETVKLGLVKFYH